MYDKPMALETLKLIEKTLVILIDGTADIADINELPKSATGMLRLNGIYMSLLTVGETVKNISKHSDILIQYPAVPWRNIMGLRDIIAHHYFEVDDAKIFSVLRTDIPALLVVIRQMITDLKQQMDEEKVYTI